LHVSAPPVAYYNRTAYLGTTVKFPCPTKLEEDVVWRKWKTISDYPSFVYTPGKMNERVSPRMTVDQNSSYALVIAKITADDSAIYGCQEDTGFGSYHLFILTIAGELHCFISLAGI